MEIIEKLKPYFPITTGAVAVKLVKSGNDKTDLFVNAVILYVIALIIANIVFGILGIIPIVGIITWIVGALFDLYVTVGIILTVLIFLDIVK